jgi:hypothetical protein
VKLFFVAATAAQLIFGLWRARTIETSVLPAIALTALIAIVGLARLNKSLARFGALLAATAGILSAISAFNAPLIGNVARISVPLFALAIAAILMTAGLERRLEISAAILFTVAFAVLEYDLTRDALWERSGRSHGLQSRR